VYKSARRCTWLPRQPSPGVASARASRPWKLKNGEVLVQFRCSFQPAGRFSRLALPGARLKPVTKRAKTYQNAPNHALATQNQSCLRSISPAERSGWGRIWGRFLSRTGPRTNFIFGHRKSSLVISAGMAGSSRPTAPAQEFREKPPAWDLLSSMAAFILPVSNKPINHPSTRVSWRRIASGSLQDGKVGWWQQLNNHRP
jgi:hypothetical protein